MVALFSSDVTIELLRIFLLLFILLPAAMEDYRTKKVPNGLSMVGWVLGPVLHLSLLGVDGLLTSAEGFLWLFLITFPLWLLGWLGAADVKLMSSVGAIVGAGSALVVLIAIFITGLIFAVVVSLYRGDLANVVSRLYYAALFRNTAEIKGQGGGAHLPYAIPIAFGSLFGMLYLQL